MGYETDGMKLRDLARSSSSPTSVMPAFHTFRSRFWTRETASRSRKSSESVRRSSSALRLLTLMQRTTVVAFLGVLHCPRHPGSPTALPIWTHRGDRNFNPRTCYRSASFSYSLIFEQNQSNLYREVLIAGDLSEEDIDRAFTYVLSANVSQP